jgi:mitochondrial fission protein ELM1
MNQAKTPDPLTCWAMSDGTVGMEIQCRGLAEAMGLEPKVKRIQVRRPWRWLPPHVWHDPLGRLGPDGDLLAPPWPDVLISCGRPTVAPAAALRKASGGRTFTVQIQNPTIGLDRFDVVVVPKHDRITGPNVVETLGGLNHITRARIEAAAARFGPRFADLPRPLVAVLVGGANKVYRMTPAIARGLGKRLAELSRREGAGLLVTPSRRTHPDLRTILRESLDGVPAAFWDGSGENPYFAYLALADAFVVTGDSVNMVSEAATTGKPVYVVDLEGGSAKFRRFHAAMREAGITRPFNGALETWSYPALRDTQQAAEEIRRRLAQRREAQETTPRGEKPRPL